MKITDFNDKKCFITGAASGIGRATAVEMAKQGARLFLTDIDKKHLEELVSHLKENGAMVQSWEALDISNFDEVKKFTAAIHEAYGPMDIVMNIAGTSTWGTVEQLQHRHWKKMVDINLMGPIHVMECLLPAMVRGRKGGYLVNVSSAAGIVALPMHAAYSAGKFGLRGISEVLRYDLRRHRIGVSVVCPGAVKTPLINTAEIVGVDRTRHEVRKFIERFEKRAVTPEHVARKIIIGMRNNRFIITTSFDIKLLYWCKRKIYIMYHIVMLLLNAMMTRILKQAWQEAR
ncbi:MAG TPA: SDR family oxidoreductase [Spirochaetota bacterium]|nr:SDR family oxidoreductase [Spirochaetota bacterium]